MRPVSGTPDIVTVVRKSIARFLAGACEPAYDIGAIASAAVARGKIHLMLYPECVVDGRKYDPERRLFPYKRNPQKLFSALCGATSARRQTKAPAPRPLPPARPETECGGAARGASWRR